jgi:hypothetical protein
MPRQYVTDENKTGEICGTHEGSFSPKTRREGTTWETFDTEEKTNSYYSDHWRNWMWSFGLVSVGSEPDLLIGYYEHTNEPSGYAEHTKFLQNLTNIIFWKGNPFNVVTSAETIKQAVCRINNFIYLDFMTSIQNYISKYANFFSTYGFLATENSVTNAGTQSNGCTARNYFTRNQVSLESALECHIFVLRAQQFLTFTATAFQMHCCFQRCLC